MSILLKDSPSNYREWAMSLIDNRVRGGKEHMVKNLIKAAAFYFKGSFWEQQEDNVSEMNVGTGPQST